MIKFNLGKSSTTPIRPAAFGDDDDQEEKRKRQLPLVEKIKLNEDGGQKPANEAEPTSISTALDAEDAELTKVMGFGTFGRPDKPDNKPKATLAKKPAKETHQSQLKAAAAAAKTARKFDVEELMRQHEATRKVVLGPVAGPPGSDSSEEEEEEDEPKKVEENEEDEDDMIGPPLPPGFNAAGDDEPASSSTRPTKKSVKFQGGDDGDEDDNDEDYADDSDNRYNVLPITHEVELKHGVKSITALALDPNGARLVTGGIDYEVKFWDFQGMDSSLQSFRTIKPCQSHSIKHLEYNSNGELILIISGSCTAKLVDRDGFVKAETVKGDQYITDKSKTKGHVAMLNAGTWHPMERSLFATTSNDYTARLWDITLVSGREIGKHKSLIKPRSKVGGWAQPNSVAFSTIGDLIALGCNDGSVQMWDTRKPFINTTHLIRPAHQADTEITSVKFAYSGHHLLTRGMDSTMKLWDMRMLKSSRLSYTPGRSSFEALHSWDGLFNRYSQTDCFFSPDDRLAVTGVSCDERSSSLEAGSLRFFDCTTFETVQEVTCGTRASVIRSLWHPKLNQIVASSADGSVRMMYDLQRSSRGALLCSFRVKRKRKDVFTSAKPQIITPHALPMFKQERRKSKFVQMLKDRKDPIKSRQPELPVTGAGAGGRLASAGKTFASFIAKNLGVKAKIDDNEDPREALLRHAKEAAENPYWVTPAYSSTQPKAIFADPAVVDESKSRDDEDDEYEVDEEGVRKRRKHVPI